MDDIEPHLQNVQFPAGRHELIDAAREAGAPTALISRLEALGDRQYSNVEAVRQGLMRRRAESNPGLVAIAAEVCEQCGFPRMPGKPHSCIEEKARFAESAQAVTDEFDLIDDAADSAPPAGS